MQSIAEATLDYYSIEDVGPANNDLIGSPRGTDQESPSEYQGPAMAV